MLVPRSTVWKDLGGGREAVGGPVVAERVEDVADDRGPELGPNARIAPTIPSRITAAAKRRERSDMNASMKSLVSIRS